MNTQERSTDLATRSLNGTLTSLLLLEILLFGPLLAALALVSSAERLALVLTVLAIINFYVVIIQLRSLGNTNSAQSPSSTSTSPYENASSQKSAAHQSPSGSSPPSQT